MGRTNYQVSRPGFIADAASIARNNGRQIDFNRVPDSYKDGDGNKVVDGSTIVSELGSGKVMPRVDTKASITNLTEDGTGTATATTSSDHGYEVGDEVEISGADVSAYNGTWIVASVPTSTTFTFDGVEGGPVDDTSGATSIIKALGILWGTARENSKNAGYTGQGVIVGGVIYKNLLADHGDSDFATFLSELKAAGTGFVFEDYSDNR